VRLWAGGRMSVCLSRFAVGKELADPSKPQQGGRAGD
jgi:hypothetical protein